MIIGIGNDLVEVNRMEEAYNNSAFANKYFTDQEKSMIAGNFQRAAGNFAVKEAVSKVFGTGFRGFSPIDIEVLRGEPRKRKITSITIRSVSPRVFKTSVMALEM